MSYGEVFKILKDNNVNIWLEYTKHEFVQKLSNDTLHENCFLNYLKQDYLFLIQFSKAWSLAILKSDNLEEMKIAASTVNELINFEMGLHIGLCEKYGISKLDLENTEEENENIAYTRYVLELGYSGDFLDLLSALAPCVLGYGEIGIIEVDAETKAKAARKAMLFSRKNTILSIPMLVAMTVAQNSFS